jgi:hypothetical protein
MQTETKILRPDAKGRVALGELAKGISSFHVSIDKKQRIILEPFSEIPAREAWLFANKKALASVLKGIEQSAKGQTVSLGSFAKFAED